MRLTDALLSPHGRLNRAGFWGGYFTMSIVTAFIAAILLFVSEMAASRGVALGDPGFRLWMVALVLLVPVTWMSFCIAVKRWHDRGRSGWWVVIGLVPLIGNLWGLIECGFLAGTKSGNKYGPSTSKAAMPQWYHEEIPEDMA
ncbi:DUF805 domain-containing protein [Asticcacaulis sp. BE141]|nr:MULTISPECIES: DUF805 domain-containing protein [Asticcacaulis]